jgi:hypothetical protein
MEAAIKYFFFMSYPGPLNPRDGARRPTGRGLTRLSPALMNFYFEPCLPSIFREQEDG